MVDIVLCQSISILNKIVKCQERDIMAELINIEDNISIKMNLYEIMEMGESDYETWISCSLKIKSKTINCVIGQNNSFMLNVYELNNFIREIRNILNCFVNTREYSFDFSNYEYNFEIKMDNVIVDKVIEIEIWINWGNYTNGKEGGYDIGIRFIVEYEVLQKFSDSINEEMIRVLKK